MYVFYLLGLGAVLIRMVLEWDGKWRKWRIGYTFEGKERREGKEASALTCTSCSLWHCKWLTFSLPEILSMACMTFKEVVHSLFLSWVLLPPSLEHSSLYHLLDVCCPWFWSLSPALFLPHSCPLCLDRSQLSNPFRPELISVLSSSALSPELRGPLKLKLLKM